MNKSGPFIVIMIMVMVTAAAVAVSTTAAAARLFFFFSALITTIMMNVAKHRHYSSSTQGTEPAAQEGRTLPYTRGTNTTWPSSNWPRTRAWSQSVSPRAMQRNRKCRTPVMTATWRHAFARQRWRTRESAGCLAGVLREVGLVMVVSLDKLALECVL